MPDIQEPKFPIIRSIALTVFFIYIIYGCRSSRDVEKNTSGASSDVEKQRESNPIRLRNGEAKKISKSAIEIESEIVFKKRMEEYNKRKAAWPFKARELQLVESELASLSDRITKLKNKSQTNPASQKRFWRSNDGRFSTEATLVGIGSGDVSLEKTDGTLVHVKMEKLSASDIEFIQVNFKLITNNNSLNEDSSDDVKQLEDRLNELLDKHISILQSNPVEPNLSKIREELENRKANAVSEASTWAELRSKVIEDASKPQPPPQASTQSTPLPTGGNPNFELFLAELISSKAGMYISAVNKNREIKNTVDVYVFDRWHYLPYQVRYQMAQVVQVVWARCSRLSAYDDARIKIMDLNGNDVGGSTMFGGSIIWVSR
jgi:hypothetical protein